MLAMVWVVGGAPSSAVASDWLLLVVLGPAWVATPEQPWADLSIADSVAALGWLLAVASGPAWAVASGPTWAAASAGGFG